MSNNNKFFIRRLQEKNHLNLPKAAIDKLNFDQFVKIVINEGSLTVTPLGVN